MPNYHISFWNLENLFDIENSPNRSEKLERAIDSEVEGWTQVILNQKLARLTQIISLLNQNQGPDILGVCEVENESVLGELSQSLNANIANRNYQVAHHNSPDRRGIDVAFIYDSNLFRIEQNENNEELIFNHFVLRRTATRDILQVNFLTSHSQFENRLVLISNHWPSRRGGTYESNGYRQIAGETLSYFHGRIREINGDDTAVLAMGDFNDEPFDPSLTQYGLSLRSLTRVINGQSPYFLNLMWPLMEEGSGTYFFSNLPNMFDQFLANENMLKPSSTFRVNLNSIEINNFDIMVNQNSDYPTPVRFGRPSNDNLNTDGFSDHFPISIQIQEV